MRSKEYILADATELRGNWKRFKGFSWHRRYILADADEWAIVYTHNSSSTRVELVNAAALELALNSLLSVNEPDLLYELEEKPKGVWVAGFSVCCLRGGKPTEAFIRLRQLMEERPKDARGEQ